jgi:nitroreductase
MTNTLQLLHTRRSVVARNLGEPGPDAVQLENILRAGLRVPDHGKLAPWRFIVIQGAARGALGEHLVTAYRKNVESDAAAARIEFARNTFTRAPVVIAVISRVSACKIPAWEQILSSGAVCQNMLLAACAQGFAAQWITEWYAYDADAKAALGLDPEENIAGFIYIGSATEPPQERPRPGLADVVSYWQEPTAS